MNFSKVKVYQRLGINACNYGINLRIGAQLLAYRHTIVWVEAHDSLTGICSL